MADFSKLGKLAIVSINQRRILDDQGNYDMGLLGDKKGSKASIVSGVEGDAKSSSSSEIDDEDKERF